MIAHPPGSVNLMRFELCLRPITPCKIQEKDERSEQDVLEYF